MSTTSYPAMYPEMKQPFRIGFNYQNSTKHQAFLEAFDLSMCNEARKF